MKRPELEQLLEAADAVDDLRSALGRARTLEGELDRDAAIERDLPRMVSALAEQRTAIAGVTRELEREWVAQGPMLSQWQRAVDLAEQAEAAGADSSEYRQDAERARARLEAARLETRDRREALVAARAHLVDLLLELPIEVELPAPVRDDGRPEAVRRDALDYDRLAGRAAGEAEDAARQARERLTEARAELDRLGWASALEERLHEAERELPAEVELPPSAPPSAERRLGRAGIAVVRSGGE
ncbi:MAG TPA: hypothetical protein VFQ71_08125 [Gaiellales bacterium]|jgi:hypothetical protein|nr:hypothetical protein [Gaiellales bacterium]